MEHALQLSANDYTASFDPERLDSATATCWLIESSQRFDENRAAADIALLQRLLVLKLAGPEGHYITFLRTKGSSKKSLILKKLLFTSTPAHLAFKPYINKNTVLNKMLRYIEEHKDSLLFDWGSSNDSSAPNTASLHSDASDERISTMIEMIANGSSLLELYKYDFKLYSQYMIMFDNLRAEIKSNSSIIPALNDESDLNNNKKRNKKK